MVAPILLRYTQQLSGEEGIVHWVQLGGYPTGQGSGKMKKASNVMIDPCFLGGSWVLKVDVDVYHEGMHCCNCDAS